MTAPVDIPALRALLEKATKGPVAWMGNGPHNVYLATTHSGRIFVMGFKRMGAQGAQPVFPKDGRLVPASDMLKFEVGDHSVTGMANAKADGSVYRYDIRDIDNPEAQLLVAARNALPSLLDEIERLREALERMHRAFNAKKPISKHEGDALEAMCRAALSRSNPNA